MFLTVPSDDRAQSAEAISDAIINFVRFDSEDHDTLTGRGCLSTPTKDLPFEIEPCRSNNPKMPVAHIISRSPAGHRIEIGAIWHQTHADGSDTHLLLSIPGMGLQAFLDKFPGRDDPNLMVINPWAGSML